jgi:superoxide dismutase
MGFTERTESEKTSWKNKQAFSFQPQLAQTPAEKEAEEVFKKVSNEISLMQFAYRRKHQSYCGNLQDLIDDHLSIERSEVSQELKDMINNGTISIELTSTGYRLKI